MPVIQDKIYFFNGIDYTRYYDGTTLTEDKTLPIGKYGIVHLDTIFLLNTPNNPSQVVYCDPNTDPTNKDNWKKQPSTMLQWRCVSKVCRFMFPECLMGVSLTPEELGAEIDEEGRAMPPKDVTPKPVDLLEKMEKAQSEFKEATELKVSTPQPVEPIELKNPFETKQVTPNKKSEKI